MPQLFNNSLAQGFSQGLQISQRQQNFQQEQAQQERFHQDSLMMSLAHMQDADRQRYEQKLISIGVHPLQLMQAQKVAQDYAALGKQEGRPDDQVQSDVAMILDSKNAADTAFKLHSIYQKTKQSDAKPQEILDAVNTHFPNMLNDTGQSIILGGGKISDAVRAQNYEQWAAERNKQIEANINKLNSSGLAAEQKRQDRASVNRGLVAAGIHQGLVDPGEDMSWADTANPSTTESFLRERRLSKDTGNKAPTINELHSVLPLPERPFTDTKMEMTSPYGFKGETQTPEQFDAWMKDALERRRKVKTATKPQQAGTLGQMWQQMKPANQAQSTTITTQQPSPVPPEMQQAVASTLPTANTRDEAMALPPGSHFIGPDGREHVRP